MATVKNAAAIGQAINLAAADARKHNRESDVLYIYHRQVFWTSVCEAIQSGDTDMLLEVIESPKFTKLMKDMQNYFDEVLNEKA
jgi:hypothetical protein